MSECKRHKMFTEDYDTCPVCEGEQAERSRIVKLLKEVFIQKRDAGLFASLGLIEAIKIIQKGK